MPTSFDELGLDPHVVESLSAEGFEFASTFQEESIPVVRRGNNLVGVAGPGSGTLLAYGAALLDRLDPEAPGPQAIILTPTASRATELARRLARIGIGTGHAVSALGPAWALPESADVIFGTPDDFLAAVKRSSLKLDPVRAVVLDGAAQIFELHPTETVTTLAGSVPADAQRVVISLPLSDEVEAFLEGYVKRPIRVPAGRSKGAEEDPGAGIPRRGTLEVRIVDGPRGESLLRVLGRLLDDEARHVLVHFHSDDEAADVGDYLSLHGYHAGAPGNAALPVWLGVDALESRGAVDGLDNPDIVSTVSYRVPLDADALDLRHGRGGASVVLLRGRELPHLEEIASVAGYELKATEDPSPKMTDDVDAFRARIRAALDADDLAPYYLIIEPLIEEEGAVRTAAALASILRKTPAGSHPGSAILPDETRGPSEAYSPPAWVRLFISLGQKDGAGPGDILGAIAGEAEIDGSKVGRIDLQETFSIVEVDQTVADKVIRSMNGTTVKGRSLRVDFHRPRGGQGSGSRQGSRRT